MDDEQTPGEQFRAAVGQTAAETMDMIDEEHTRRIVKFYNQARKFAKHMESKDMPNSNIVGIIANIATGAAYDQVSGE